MSQRTRGPTNNEQTATHFHGGGRQTRSGGRRPKKEKPENSDHNPVPRPRHPSHNLRFPRHVRPRSLLSRLQILVLLFLPLLIFYLFFLIYIFNLENHQLLIYHVSYWNFVCVRVFVGFREGMQPLNLGRCESFIAGSWWILLASLLVLLNFQKSPWG